MAKRLSTVLNVSPNTLESAGVFDRFVGMDSLLYVDPHLLPRSTFPEMQQASSNLDEYWSDSARIIRRIMDYGDRFWREAVARFQLSEHPNMGLGYSTAGNSGSAVGKSTAIRLVETARQIVSAGIDDPKIFELVGLFESGVGPDLLSDMTIRVVEPDLLRFTERISNELGVSTVPTKVGKKHFDLPINPESGDYIVLFPADILNDLPVAFCWEDVDEVCQHNSDLRERMNGLIGANWKRATEDNSKTSLFRALIENPGAFQDLLGQYRTKRSTPYDFNEDTLGENIWPESALEAASRFPLDLSAYGSITPKNIRKVVLEICDHFRNLVEYNGLSAVFWTKSGKVRHERVAQLVFFGIADAYCRANNLDLSPETNSGRGPVDFKISGGYSTRTLVEVKWSKNSKLVHGYETQLKEYEKAERTHHSVFLIIRVTESTRSIRTVCDRQNSLQKQGKPCPDVRIIDGMRKDPASTFES